MSTSINIPMLPVSAYRTASYEIMYESKFVYRTRKSSAPTRVVMWGNTERPNPRNGEPVRYGDYGPIDGGNGRYLDPNNNPTDDPVTVLLSPESTAITDNGTNTGTEASGQVYAPERLATDATVTSSFRTVPVLITAYSLQTTGHGYLTS